MLVILVGSLLNQVKQTLDDDPFPKTDILTKIAIIPKTHDGVTSKRLGQSFLGEITQCGTVRPPVRQFDRLIANFES